MRLTEYTSLAEVEERIATIYRTYAAIHGPVSAPEVGELAALWEAFDTHTESESE